tara:strand:+ start:190 stop:372 length:183 start_codon:yes stop_codon:yes gene_type:complete
LYAEGAREQQPEPQNESPKLKICDRIVEANAIVAGKPLRIAGKMYGFIAAGSIVVIIVVV